MITLIAAIGKNRELGKDNKLIWYIPDDLKFFRKTTTDHTVVMGYNTYKSIGKALPNRKNIVITTKDIEIDGAVVYHNIDDMLKKEMTNDEVFIIGGASLYKHFYPIASKMYLTEIDDEDKEADVYFPEFDEGDWDREILFENKDNEVKYKHVLYKRKK